MRKAHKKIIFWLAVVLVLVGSVWTVIAGSGGGDSASVTTDKISAEDWTKGTPGASIEIIEYSDFQCPACRGFESLINPILAEFSSHVYFAYRHFPLKSIHPNATLAARAAEAAGLQGKFWEMHEKLFETQSAWAQVSNQGAKETFSIYASELGLDLAQFRKDIESSAIVNKVEDAYDHAVDAGVSYTPSVFINGQLIKNPGSVEQFRSIIRSHLEK